MPVPPSTPPTTTKAPKGPPADPAPWLERTEELVDAYRRQLPAAATSAELGLGYIWIAADHIFECQGARADFALLDVMKLMEDCHWLLAGKSVSFVGALASFYAFLGAAQVIDGERAEQIRAALLEHRCSAL